LAGQRRTSIRREHLLGVVGADPRPQPNPVTAPPPSPPLLRPLAEYEAVTGGTF
jgi:hypothetical protein